MKSVPIAEIAMESAHEWLGANLHALDADRHVRLHVLINPGSQDLQTLFAHREPGRAPLANDTSIGVGYAPLSRLERPRSRHRENDQRTETGAGTTPPGART